MTRRWTCMHARTHAHACTHIHTLGKFLWLCVLDSKTKRRNESGCIPLMIRDLQTEDE